MPSSLIFAALAAAWLVVLVPMVARRRKPVARTADSALTGRVVRRGGETTVDTPRRGQLPEENAQEVFAMPGRRAPEPSNHRDSETEDYDNYSDGRTDHYAEDYGDESVNRRARRRYRPGRGGFDPELAAMVARAKYQFRQRVVLGMLLLALATGLLAGFALPVLWWAHGATDVILVGYLTYLRRQVRIEEEIRNRRLARIRGTDDEAVDTADEAAEDDEDETYQVPAPKASAKPAGTRCSSRPSAELIDLDDEDPSFEHLDPPAQMTYRRASGE
ncbi:divisome protein SepX/GlpR [Allokutzneria oryzae]|uniref:Gephyrin-like molybdotransferase receptor GlpR n=1 Tax=Allokutzneria oryzae TaxID=1378989 RepID=A0ABV5ZX73_9PSEU